MAITLRRSRSKKQQAWHAAKSGGKKAAQAKVVVGTGRAARKGAGTAAKGGAIAFAFAKARRPLLALAAIAGGAAVALKLKSAKSGSGAEAGATDTMPATPEAPAGATQHPAMAGMANGTGPTPAENPAIS